MSQTLLTACMAELAQVMAELAQVTAERDVFREIYLVRQRGQLAAERMAHLGTVLAAIGCFQNQRAWAQVWRGDIPPTDAGREGES